jgi:hypothetical protein
MALVITLILLAVTLVMALAFIAVARRGRTSVTTTTDTTTARLAGDAALAAAQAQIAASVLDTNNGNNGAYNFSLLVSTNYINANGFDPNGGPSGFGPASPTNVNYDYRTPASGGGALTAQQMAQNIANLWLQPRVPVFVVTNKQTGSNEFRYYLDLNRNGQPEANGLVPVISPDPANPYYYFNPNNANDARNGTTMPAPLAGLTLSNVVTGDPEWIGVLEHPDQPHGPNNRFIARYAFIAQPVGNGLDLNYLHNQTISRTVNPSPNGQLPPGTVDGFFRNQGVGSWELNLAAFLADLNTNQWNPPTAQFYNYNPPPLLGGNTGVAFDDARALLSFRYGYNYASLLSANNMLANGATVFPNDGIDGYSDGPLQTTVDTNADFIADVPSLPWAGAGSVNRFFGLPSELFNQGNIATNFIIRLQQTGTNLSTYDRYTFYRMLEELGTDSAPDDGKLNLNYDNTDGRGNVVRGAEANQVPWTPIGFFTNAAERLLRHYTAEWLEASQRTGLGPYGLDYTNIFGMVTTNSFGVTNIPVYINGRFVYSPAVNRLLQLAANLYDASTNKSAAIGNNGRDYPSVFRPVFYRNNLGDVYISGFVEVSAQRRLTAGQPPLDQPLDITDTGLKLNAAWNDANGNIYGVPWIIGAKKGFPSFNQFYMRSTVQVTRKLQVSRQNGTQPGGTASNPSATNQMFTMSITNSIGFSFWNSYESNYVSTAGGLTVFCQDNISMTLTNAQRTWAVNKVPLQAGGTITVWPGSSWSTSSSMEKPEQTADPASFISTNWDYPFLPESDFQAQFNNFVPTGTGTWDTTTKTPPVFPQFGLMTTNCFQAYILERGHIIDYVQLSGPNSSRNLTDEIQDKPSDPNFQHNLTGALLMWVTNSYLNTGMPLGVADQIYVSTMNPVDNSNVRQFWKAPPNMPSGFSQVPAAEAAFFKGFFAPYYYYNNKQYVNTNTVVQVPYTPTRTTWEYTSWQANDPLVHHLASDLNTVTRQTGIHKFGYDLTLSSYPSPAMNALTDRYQPWGRNTQMGQLTNVDTSAFNLSFRDPLVWGSDYWDFPANKYPTVGWIGRVHRGTPWQTVYLKASDIRAKTVTFGNSQVNVGANTWAQWTGDTGTSFGRYFDALMSVPVADSDLFDLFTTRFNDNAARGSLSINQPHLAAWSALFSGVVALTNGTPVPASYTTPLIGNTFIQPAGVAGDNSPLGWLVNGPLGINFTRLNFVNSDGVVGAFEHVGDILRAPALTEASPFLNWSDAQHQQYDISDELYEWLPQQVMGLLRLSSTPRYVVYCYGQALRPAPNALVTSSGPLFGLCTNYQVVAESAARAVLRVDKNVVTNTAVIPNVRGTNYTTTVESFNPLPPD